MENPIDFIRKFKIPSGIDWYDIVMEDLKKEEEQKYNDNNKNKNDDGWITVVKKKSKK